MLIPSQSSIDSSLLVIRRHSDSGMKLYNLTNDLCLPFYNKEFLKAHPDIVVEKKSDSPDEDKSHQQRRARLSTAAHKMRRSS